MFYTMHTTSSGVETVQNCKSVRKSNNMIMADRKKLKNPNGLILGTPGSGKSFSAKREITNVFFATQDDIIVSDPESEYHPLVSALGGQVVRLSSTSKDYINPMDINMNYADDDNPLGVKSDFILSLCELIMGNRDGIEAQSCEKRQQIFERTS